MTTELVQALASADAADIAQLRAMLAYCGTGPTPRDAVYAALGNALDRPNGHGVDADLTDAVLQAEVRERGVVMSVAAELRDCAAACDAVRRSTLLLRLAGELYMALIAAGDQMLAYEIEVNTASAADFADGGQD